MSKYTAKSNHECIIKIKKTNSAYHFRTDQVADKPKPTRKSLGSRMTKNRLQPGQPSRTGELMSEASDRQPPPGEPATSDIGNPIPEMTDYPNTGEFHQQMMKPMNVKAESSNGLIKTTLSTLTPEAPHHRQTQTKVESLCFKGINTEATPKRESFTVRSVDRTPISSAKNN